MDAADGLSLSTGAHLRVQLVPLPHNWVRLPQALTNSLLGSNTTELLVLRLNLVNNADREVYVAWNGLPCREAGCVEVPAKLGAALGLQDGDIVRPQAVPGLPVATQVHAKVESVDDWEVVESNAENLTKAILQQVQVVRNGDKLPIWIRGQSTVDISVQSTQPADVVLLKNDTIVSIEPPAQPATISGVQTTNTANDIEPSKDTSADTRSRSERMLADVLRVPQTPSVSGPMRLRIKAWGADELGLSMCHSNQVVHSEYTTAVFINSELATACGLQQGAQHSLKRSADADASSTSRMPVYSHPGVPQGHVCMAATTMHQLALPEHSQIWLQKEYSPPMASAKIIKVSLQRLKPFTATQKPPEATPDAAEGAGSGLDAAAAADPVRLVQHAEANGCEILLQAAALGLHGASLNKLLQKSAGASTSSFDPLEKAPESTDVEECVLQPLRSFLISWVKALFEFQAAIRAGRTSGAASSNAREQTEITSATSTAATAPESLNMPQTSVLTICLPGQEMCSFLVSWQSNTPYRASMVSMSKAKIEETINRLEVTVGAATALPVSNPIMAIHSMARDVFWKASEHSQRHIQAKIKTEDTLIPRGKQWLDRELAKALEIAMPYLAQQSQRFWKGATVPAPGGILVAGSRGSGKSALLERCAAYLASHPKTMCHVSRMNCRAMAGDKLKRIAKWLQMCFVTSLLNAPAVIIMDDVDALIPVIPEHAPPQEQHIIAFVNEFLASVFDWLREKVTETGAQVLVIASCSDAAGLPKLLRATGRLDHLIEVGTPSAQERRGMIEHMLTVRGLSYDPAAMEGMSRRMEGFDSSDLLVVIERAVQAARLSALEPRSGAAAAAAGPAGTIKVCSEHWDAALDGFQPSAAWEAGAQDSLDATITGWNDVGGMKDAKEALYEALELPLKFAKLVAKAPLRLRTGVLLYGPPGCGKTHAVRAAVAATGVRFIGVKGPELLNKYIGASEEAVRGVFARAQAAAPCALFFDEFDSIAPQRGSGSDSTGVTERMVNQLLTELDGVEKLQGVCVIAASNRPDLIDAALLRPGRLDRLIYCGLPNIAERQEILESLLAKVKHDEAVDCAQLASQTEGYSGADLRAIVSEAQLTAVMARLEDLKAAEAAGAPHDTHAAHEAPALQASDILAALQNARPSLSQADRDAMDRRFDKFRKARDSQKMSPFSKESEAAKQSLTDKGMKVALG